MENKDAVRKAILDYLSGRTNLNVNSMNVDVTSVSFRKNEADAVVSFSPKSGPTAGQGMSMRYTLEAKDGRWVVKNRADSGSNPHGGTGAMGGGMGQNPHGGSMMPPSGMGGSGAGTLPPGHPAVPSGNSPGAAAKK
ncbi:MAG: hypothetical protein M1541_01760 [Acidobacteria bacterium]|nr:hypothetical protein [Acidobacteriota bacterium]